MDGSMDRCPQCGAAIRPSARFCVTCGIKLPESKADPVPAEASGWAARQENFAPSDSVASATTAWAMPATHSEDAQPEPINTPDNGDEAAPSAGKDVELHAATQPIDFEDATPPVAAWQSWNPAESDPEIDPSREIPTTNAVEDETTVVAENPEPVVPAAEIESIEVEESVPEPVAPVAANEDMTTEETLEPDVPPSDLEAIVIKGSSQPITVNDQATDSSGEDVATDEDHAAPDARPEPQGDANPSPLDEAAFEEIIPYAAEAGSEWEPIAEPDEIFALDEIEFERPAEFEPAAIAIGSDAPHSDANAAIPDSGDAALQRANQLIDELRSLLPALTTTAQAIQSPDYAALRAQAIAARGDISFDQFAALREVVQEALSRPRDVEVVLRLSRRVDDMNALLGERDRLQQAFEQLIASLDAYEAT